MRRVLMMTFALFVMGQDDEDRDRQYYPQGYGGYGMNRWGGDPAAGYMAGLGSYARGQGVYEVDNAVAGTINLQTMLEWNKALRARQRALREEHLKHVAERAAARDERVAKESLEDGTALNHLLLDILDSDPGVVKSSRVKTPLSPAAIREIPFEWDSEAVTMCVDQMTGEDSMPSLLMDSSYAADRKALRAAVEPALAEDAKGEVSRASRKRVVEAIAKFRADFLKNASKLEGGYEEAHDYLKTIAGLTRLMSDPSMKAFLSKLDDGKERTVGDLVAFMNAFNLRFGPTVTDRQVAIYKRLEPALSEIRAAAVSAGTPSTPPDRTGQALRSAAKGVFKRMTWGELDAHARGQ